MATLDEIEELIGRVARGDSAAFARLYSLTSGKLFAVSLHILGLRGEAEEALQESYVKIWRNAERYRVTGYSPMTWLITIARNTAIDRLRARRARGEDLAEAEALPAPEPGPEAQAVAAGDRVRLVSCLDELDEDRAAAVRGAYLAGHTYRELALRFDVPINTMRTWLRRSLMKLKECLTR